MNLLIGIVTGVVTGVLASALFWLWQAKLMRPRMAICPTLAKYALSDRQTRYQFKILNVGRRPVADVRVWVRVLMPGLVKAGTPEVINILEFERPWIAKGGSHRRRINPSHMPDDTRRSYQKYFPTKINELLRAGQAIDLVDFLKIREGSTLRVEVAATDAFSGARAYVQQLFGLDDIKEGAFLKNSCSQSGRFDDAADLHEALDDENPEQLTSGRS